MNKEKIENYAQSLVKHGLYSTIEEARIESIRWHKKQEKGFEEPLKCPHNPDIEITVTNIGNDRMIVEHKLPKKLNITEIINNYPTKYKEGFTCKEIKSLIKKYHLNEDKFYKTLGVNTCMIIGGETITYHCDIETTFCCLMENRDKRLYEWD